MSSRTFTLGDFLSVRPGRAYDVANVASDGPYLLGMGIFSAEGGFRSHRLRHYSGAYHDDSVARPGDVLVATTDMGARVRILGRSAKVPREIGPFALVPGEIGRVDWKTGDQRVRSYAYWVMRTPAFRSYCLRYARGTAIRRVRSSDIESFPIFDPAAPRISRLTGALDEIEDRIELSRSLERTLEEVLRELTKFWFVDFGPVVAKSEGRWKKGEALPGVPADTWDLWPSEFEDSELGKIPVGWTVEPLSAVAGFLNGLACQKFHVENGDGIPVLKIGELRRGNTLGADRAASSIPPGYTVQDGDLIFSWSGSLEVRFWYGGRAALNQHLFKVTSDRFPPWLCHHWILGHLENFRQIAAGKATTMGHIQRHHLDDALVVIPPAELIESCDRVISPLLAKVKLDEGERLTLSTVRDTLLPRLVPGGARVKGDA